MNVQIEDDYLTALNTVYPTWYKTHDRAVVNQIKELYAHYGFAQKYMDKEFTTAYIRDLSIDELALQQAIDLDIYTPQKTSSHPFWKILLPLTVLMNHGHVIFHAWRDLDNNVMQYMTDNMVPFYTVTDHHRSTHAVFQSKKYRKLLDPIIPIIQTTTGSTLLDI